MRRNRRSPMPHPRRKEPVAIAIAATRPAISLRMVGLLALALLLALLLPRLAGAAPAPTLEIGEKAALVQLETEADAQVVVEWGLAPLANRTVRSGGGTDHQLALVGLEPGRLYVYRVWVDGRAVTGPVPFRTEGEVPVAAHRM